MKQSKYASLIESFANIAVGLGIALLVNVVMLNWYGFQISTGQNVAMGAVMTAMSLARSFVLRRVFEALHIRRPLSPFMQAVVAERYRQVEQECWSHQHDDAHAPGDLAKAGASYALYADMHLSDRAGVRKAALIKPREWPWDRDWWRPSGFRRDLVKAGALIIAEGEKFDRQRKRPDAPTVQPAVRPRSPIITDAQTINRAHPASLVTSKPASEQGGSSA